MEENILIKVGNRLTALRKDTGKSQSDIAEILGVKIRSYAGYERAEHLPPTKVLLGLSGLYGVSIDYLLCLTDYRTGMDGEHFAKLTGLRDDAIESLIQNRRTAAIEKSIRDNLTESAPTAVAYNVLPDTVSFLLRPENTDVLYMIGEYIRSDDLKLSDDIPEAVMTENINGSGIRFDTAEVFRSAIPNMIIQRLHDLRAERLKNRK